MAEEQSARLGILMLDTAFPRPLGDIGHPESFAFPVAYARVPKASARAALSREAGALLAPFVAEGRRLVAQGCTGIGTSCGFLGPLQADLARELGVPVAASALSLVPVVARMLPAGQVPGIVTISAEHLTGAHLAAAGIAEAPPIAGCDPAGVFARTILEDRADWDAARARSDVIDAAEQLVAAHPHVGGIVLECTNMGPYAAEIASKTGRPVWSVIDLLTWFHAGLVRF
ncbi:aspartate/glutamate racemase family protein [Aestuariicoccus sp. MJ-SS9]|uniref:aspartate/glutamate racemase family protein n=1 Tax=Aestuariicoccus sp. MJ-SS9 TaxID=3079855 RepID=UPI002907DCCA|nr:aspartate/glutamate racemase family protein [Aestuariicoccus sp. MJ-SS9]MDU8912993.1 aspartate/glutamate racemase family protein [Aestuariicoccus sp. MJ-SS9]